MHNWGYTFLQDWLCKHSPTHAHKLTPTVYTALEPVCSSARYSFFSSRSMALQRALQYLPVLCFMLVTFVPETNCFSYRMQTHTFAANMNQLVIYIANSTMVESSYLVHKVIVRCLSDSFLNNNASRSALLQHDRNI